MICFHCRTIFNSIGLLTRTSKSTRQHAEEMIGNLHLIQEAYFHLNTITLMNTNFANYLLNRFTVHHHNNHLQRYRLRHQITKDDELVSLIFHSERSSSIKLFMLVEFGYARALMLQAKLQTIQISFFFLMVSIILVEFEQFLLWMMTNLIFLLLTSQIWLLSLAKSIRMRTLSTLIFNPEHLLNGITFQSKLKISLRKVSSFEVREEYPIFYDIQLLIIVLEAWKLILHTNFELFLLSIWSWQ